MTGKAATNYDRQKARAARYAAFWADPVVHPAADLLPMMSDDEIAELAEDIKANGLMTQLIVWEDNTKQTELSDDVDYPLYLLDGRNRLAALKLLGITDPNDAKRGRLLIARSGTYVTVTARDLTSTLTRGGLSKPKSTPGVNPVMFVLSANVKRRHLTPAQKRTVIAEVLKADPKLSDRTVAKGVGVDHKTAGKVREGLEGRGEIPHVDKRTDSAGREQPVKPKPKANPKPVTDPKPKPQPKPQPKPVEEPVEEPVQPEVEPATLRAIVTLLAELGSVVAELERHCTAMTFPFPDGPDGWDQMGNEIDPRQVRHHPFTDGASEVVKAIRERLGEDEGVGRALSDAEDLRAIWPTMTPTQKRHYITELEESESLRDPSHPEYDVLLKLRCDKQQRRDLRAKVDARVDGEDYRGHSGRDHDLERLNELDERAEAGGWDK